VTVAYRAGGASALATLDEASRHPIPDVREEAVRGLIAVGGASAVDRLLELARDPEPRVQTLAVAGLGGLVGGDAIDALVDVAVSPGELATRREAIDHLARHPSPEARIRLTRVAKGKTTPRVHRQLRRYAKGALRS
jgi:HEAT repeat protein